MTAKLGGNVMGNANDVVHVKSERSRHVETALLRALLRADGPLGAARLSELLAVSGIDLKPRAVRYHLRRMDAAGLTRLVDARRGRVATEQGREEIARVGAPDKLGFIAGRVDDLGYRMTYDLSTATGSVVVNVAIVDDRHLNRAVPQVELPIRARLGMGSKLIIARAGERIGDVIVPRMPSASDRSAA